jgi:hypothetical protein
MAAEAGASLVAGPSLKAALDLDWDDPRAQQHALTRLLDALHAVEYWLDTYPAPAAVAPPQVAASLAVAEQVRTQDLTAAPDGTPTQRQGVAAEQRISVEDAERRHGRKSRSLWQGHRARYWGVRKNVFDLRRCAVVYNLHVLMRLPETAWQAA